jgi:ArsR family transcriptional regulator, arsenate/arsenite/antimonite-responsive transcriptional repressor
LNLRKPWRMIPAKKIMSLTCCRWVSVSQIVEELGQVSQPTVSHHLAVLREAGLVRVRSEGKQTFYSLNQEAIASCCGNLIQVFAPESNAAQAIQDLE